MSTPISESEPTLKFGCLVVSDHVASTLPLEMTTVNLHVSGPLVSAVVTQRFGNPLEQVAHLDYLYPLLEGAAITDFTLTIGERTIRAELKETAEAANAFEQARRAGQRAGLFEQRRENLFAVRLANVHPGETILATVRYQQRVAFSEYGYELVFPMGLTPKYDRPEHPGEGAGVHAPIARSGEPIGPVEIVVALDAGSACADPQSPSHDLQTVRLDERRFQVRLAGQYIPDHDFVLRYSPLADQPVAAAWLVDTAGGGYFLANLLPPRLIDEAKPAPREFIFVLDRSGSMGGEPILQARNALRACLRALNPGDTYRILLFDDRLEWYRQEPSPVNQAEIDAADRFLAGVDARGGTEIMAALEASLGLAMDPGRTRYVVFLTDGAVSAELSALDLLRKKVGSARVFTFGIGPSVNRAMLNRMAGVGRGAAEFLQADEDIEGAILRFQDRVSFPVLTGLKLNFSGGSAWDVYPAQLPDLYAGQPLVVCGRIQHKQGEPLSLALTGTRGAETVTLTADFTSMGPDEPAVARVWARARIDDLLGEAELSPQNWEKIRAAVLEIALAHRLVSPYTSFVGVDQTSSVGDGQVVTIQVAQPLPRGLDWGRPHLSLNQPLASSPVMAKMSLPAAFTPTRGMKRNTLSRGKVEDGGILYSMEPSSDGAYIDFEAQPEVDPLRWLARTQRLDGSWDGDVERTSAALLAFARHGQTTHRGGFRVAVRRALAWLQANPGEGLARFIRAYALDVLAKATGIAEQREIADEARQGLPAPQNSTEAAAGGASGQTSHLSEPLRGLDDLRLAVLLNLNPAVNPADYTSDLERTWLACLVESNRRGSGVLK